jgi:hypothetical protein
MKPPYFSLNIWLLFSDLFRIRILIRIRNPDPKSGSKTGSEMFISVLDRIRIRPKVSDPYGSSSGSGSATLLIFFCTTCNIFAFELPPFSQPLPPLSARAKACPLIRAVDPSLRRGEVCEGCNINLNPDYQ